MNISRLSVPERNYKSFDVWIGFQSLILVLFLCFSYICWVLLLTIVFFWFLGIKWLQFAWKVGVVASCKAHTLSCLSIKQLIGWILSFMMMTLFSRLTCFICWVGIYFIMLTTRCDNLINYHIYCYGFGCLCFISRFERKLSKIRIFIF